LVTSYETSRACKPSLLYYRQILETIGAPAEACLMVGNEAADMVAGRLGCATYFTGAHDTAFEDGIPEPTYRGTLGELEHMLRQPG
jgi:FMN phosphatase YigB (HAD superfamily)